MNETHSPAEAPDGGSGSRSALSAPEFAFRPATRPSRPVHSYIRVDAIASVPSGMQRYHLEVTEDFRSRYIAYVPAVIVALIVGGVALVAAGARSGLAALPFVLAVLAVAFMSGYLSLEYVPDDDGEYVEAPRR
jgi:hypothetical protein